MNLTRFDSVSISLIILIAAVVLCNHLLFKSQPKDTQQSTLGIDSLITKVRDELILAQNRNRLDSNLNIFELKDFDLEIKFVVTKNNTISGKAEFNVVTVGDETSVSNEKVQTIKLHMTTVSPENESVPIKQ